MRLLRTHDLTLHEFFDEQVPQYAILSHTWGAEEITYQEMIEAATSDSKSIGKQGYKKIQGFATLCKYEYCWVDTCCIDKKSSAELTEAINSMYTYYKRAAMCVVYLSDVSQKNQTSQMDTVEDQVRKSRWFTRGWTLQELIAPRHVEFFDQDWCKINISKIEIAEIAEIPMLVLEGGWEMSSICINTKMGWAAKRTTTRVEDMAYCLMGIFEVNMPLLYGEGSQAFHRLQEEIIRKKNDETIFIWVAPYADSRTTGACSIFARHPSQFTVRSGTIRLQYRYPDPLPYALTNLGLHMSVRLLPLQSEQLQLSTRTMLPLDNHALQPSFHPHFVGQTLFAPILNCKHADSVQLLSIVLKRLRPGGNLFVRICPEITVTIPPDLFESILYKQPMEEVYILDDVRGVA